MMLNQILLMCKRKCKLGAFKGIYTTHEQGISQVARFEIHLSCLPHTRTHCSLCQLMKRMHRSTPREQLMSYNYNLEKSKNKISYILLHLRIYDIFLFFIFRIKM